MYFKQWLEWEDLNEIRGEYWIIDGFVNFADGDIGDQNHEGIAIDYVFSYYSESIGKLAEELGIEFEFDRYGEVNTEGVVSTLWEIHNKLESKMGEQQAHQYISKNIECNSDAYEILFGGGDARLYVMIHCGWIAIRKNNVELYNYNANRQKEIADAISEVLFNEGKDLNDLEVELTIYDHKTNRSWYVTLEDLKSPSVAFRPSQPLQTMRRDFTPKDTEENKYSNLSKSRQSAWNIAAQKAGLGTELWRGTSESFCWKKSKRNTK